MKSRMGYFLGWGVILWLIATVFFRLVGQLLLNPGSLAPVILIFIATVPLIAAVTYPVYAKRAVPFAELPVAATCIALPGMVLDVVSLSFFGAAFPNLAALPGSAGALFGAWMLWAYALILLSGLLPLHSRRGSSRAAS